jgi:hypothetical protein
MPSSQRNSSVRFAVQRTWSAGATLVLVLAIFAAQSVHAQSEDEIKAAFLLNFARYVEWPTSAFDSDQAPVRICMSATSGFDRVLAGTVEGKTVGPRSVDVQVVEDFAAASACHILYLDSLGGADEVVAVLGEASVFSVASDEGFADQGGIANFYREGNRIRFEINPGAARKAGLKISSRLLRLARLVE